MSNSQTTNTYHPGVALADIQLIIEKTPRDVWDALRNQRIFITGGTGFVGCWFLEALLWANHVLQLKLSVHVLTRNPDAFIAKAAHLATNTAVTLIKGDVTNLVSIQSNFDVVIHAATDVVKPGINPIDVYKDIVAGTEQTLHLAQRCNAKKYLLTSSGAVYGQQPSLMTHVAEAYEGAPLTTAKQSAYGQAKRVSEWLAVNYNQYFDVKIARLFALLGPYLPLDAHFAAGNFIRDGLADKTIAINGDGTAHRSYLYAADMVVWLLTVLIKGESAVPYNVGSDESISIKELAEKISHIVYQENRVTLAKQADPRIPPARYVPDNTKAKHELQLAEYTDLTAAINKTIAWAQEQSPTTAE